MKLNRIFIIFIVLNLFFMTGCWNSREINTLAVTICIGIDKSEDGYLITQQVLNPKGIASEKALEEAPVIVYSDTGKDIFEVFRKITLQSPRKIYNAHLRMIVIGEKIAEEGIKNILDFFSRNYEFRTDFYFVIAKGTTANNVLSILTPLVSIPGMEMYDSIKTSQDIWAPTKTIRIIELMNSINSKGKNPIMTGIEITDGSIDSTSTDALKKSNGIKKHKYTTLGILKRDKLVGWLDVDESKGYNYILGDVKSTVGHVYYSEKVKVTIEVKSVKSKINAYIKNGKPAIDVEIVINENIGAVEGDFDITKLENQKIIEEIGDTQVKGYCERAINKAKDLKTDIFGFGDVIYRKHPKYWETIQDNWDNEFSKLQVNVAVKQKIKNMGQFTKPYYMKEKK